MSTDEETRARWEVYKVNIRESGEEWATSPQIPLEESAKQERFFATWPDALAYAFGRVDL